MKKCFDLIMKKEFALAILRGEKTVEYRAGSDFYFSKFLDKKKLADYNPEDRVPFKEGVDYIHFHNYNNSWFMDVEFDRCDLLFLNKETKNFLNTFFNSAEMDEACDYWEEESQKNPDIYLPQVFYFEMGDVLNTDLELQEDLVEEEDANLEEDEVLEEVDEEEEEDDVNVLELLCPEEVAIDILSGKQKVLSRPSTYVMDKLFFDDEAIDEDGEEGDWILYDWIRLRDGKGSWYVDVEMEDILCTFYNAKGKELLNKRFHCHDFDEKCDEYNQNEDEYYPTYFVLLGDVLDTNLE